MARSTTGKGTLAQRWPKLPADDPLYKAGWIVGQRRAATFSTKAEPEIEDLWIGDWTEAIDGFLVEGARRGGVGPRPRKRRTKQETAAIVEGEAEAKAAPRSRIDELFKPASPDDPIYKAGWLMGHRRAADYATRPPPQETAAEREGRLESEAFDKHRERQRRPRPANPDKPSGRQ